MEQNSNSDQLIKEDSKHQENVERSKPKGLLDRYQNINFNAAIIAAFLPCPLFLLGIHDFIIKSYKNGIIHLVLATLAGVLLIPMGASSYSNVVPGVISTVIIVISYIWSIIEGVGIIKLRDQVNQVIANEYTAQEIAEQNQEKSDRSSQMQSRLSITLSIMCLILSIIMSFSWRSITKGGLSSNSGGGIGGAFVALCCLALDILLFSLSIVYAFWNIKTKNRKKCIISLSIHAIAIVAIVLIMVL